MQDMQGNMVDGIEAKLLLDERVNVDSRDTYVIEKPASYIRYYQDSSSNVSNSSIHFSIVPPSAGVCVDKRIQIELDALFTINFSNSSTDAPAAPTDARYFPTTTPDIIPTVGDPPVPGPYSFYNSGIACLRSFPLHSVLESVSMTLNQTTITMNPSDVIPALSRCGFTKEWMDDQEAPTQPDTLCNFSNYNSSTGAIYGSTSARSPFNGVVSNGAQAPRGAWQAVPFEVTSVNVWNPQCAEAVAGPPVVLQNANALIRFKWCETLMLSPLLFKRLWQEEPAFSGLTNIDITLNLGDLSRMLCLAKPDDTRVVGANGAAGTLFVNSVTGSLTGAITGSYGGARDLPKAHMCYLTPSVIQELPRVRHYPYYELNRYPNVDRTLNAFQQNVDVSMNNIQLSSVPKRILVFARISKNTADYYRKSDVFARIDNLQINFNNKNALLGSASAYDLWRMSKRNGLNATWPEYNELLHCGAPVIIDFGKDISLDADEAVGSFGQFQLQINMRITNLCAEPVTYQPMIVVISEGVFTVQDTSTFLSVGSVLPRNILNAEALSALDRLSLQDVYDYNGGSFWGTVKRVASKAWSGLKKGAQYLAEHPEMIRQVADIGRQFLPQPLSGAIGVAEQAAERLAPMIRGQGLQPGRGGYSTGGRQMRRQSLRSRM